MRQRPIYKDQCQELNKSTCAIVLAGTQIFGPSLKEAISDLYNNS